MCIPTCMYILHTVVAVLSKLHPIIRTKNLERVSPIRRLAHVLTSDAVQQQTPRPHPDPVVKQRVLLAPPVGVRPPPEDVGGHEVRAEHGVGHHGHPGEEVGHEQALEDGGGVQHAAEDKRGKAEDLEKRKRNCIRATSDLCVYQRLQSKFAYLCSLL